MSADPERIRRDQLRRLDAALRRIPIVDRSPVACEAGCDFCCHLRVMATPAEVFGLADFIMAKFTEDDLKAFKQRLELAASQVRQTPATRLLSTNIPCPVLVEGRCSAYAARPFNCRSYHSLDRAACERSFQSPEDRSLGHPQFSKVARVHEAIQSELLDQTRATGHDHAQYELVTALQEAFDNPGARERFRLKHGPVFQRAVEVLI